MKKFYIIIFLTIICRAQYDSHFGEPDHVPHNALGINKKMSLPGYNPTAIISKPPNSIEYKTNNILPYGQWNNVLEKEKNRTKFFVDKDLEKVRTAQVGFNEDKLFNTVYPEEINKLNWLKSLPKNNVFISKNNKSKLNDTKDSTGTYHNFPHTNLFYSSFPNYEPVPLPAIENEPVILKKYFFNIVLNLEFAKKFLELSKKEHLIYIKRNVFNIKKFNIA